MAETHLLLTDPTLPQAPIQQTVGRENHLFVFDYRQQFSAHIADGSSASAKEIKPLLDKGDTIPDALLTQFLQTALNNINGKNILLAGFPKNPAHFETLRQVLAKLGRTIDKVWYFAHDNQETFIANYLQDENHRLWQEKFGSDMVENWQAAQQQTDLLIESIRQAQPHLNWETIKRDCGQNQPKR